MKRSFKDFLPIILKVALIIGVIIGVCTTGSSDDTFVQSSRFLYFTIQSNITIGLICAVFLVFDVLALVKNKPLTIPNWLLTVKFVFTVAITLTFLVFSLILAPFIVAGGNAGYLLTSSNICCHNLVPIIAIVDWLLFNYKHQSNKLTFLWGAAMPLYYVAFAFICDSQGVDFGGGMTVPYFFFNYHEYGWFLLGDGKIGVAYWIALQVLMVLGIGYLLILFKCKIALRHSDKPTQCVTDTNPS